MIQLMHRIVLTEKCNMKCPHCFNAEARFKGEMDVEVFYRYMEKNKKKIVTLPLKVMGGEPTVHPRFREFITTASKYFQYVNIFTNGTRPELLQGWMPNKVSHTVNAYTYKPGTTLSNMTLHCVVLGDDLSMLRDKILATPGVDIRLSPNTQVNLFDEEKLNWYRKVWVKALTTLVPLVPQERVKVDHCLPVCFYTPEMLEEIHKHDLYHYQLHSVLCCGEVKVGLIDYNFDLYFCNQTRIKLGSLLENGEPKDYDDIIAMIQVAHRLKSEGIKRLSSKCVACGALPLCKAGCYYNILEGETNG